MVIVLMGVTGSGKTTVGRRLAEELGWPFYEGDDFHPQVNVARMSQGIPLEDSDRKPWLDRLQELIHRHLQAGTNAVIACSALKKWYRAHLAQGSEEVCFIYLKGEQDLIQGRLEDRQGHFMPPGLLNSQFETLEEPDTALVINISRPPDEIIRSIKDKLDL